MPSRRLLIPFTILFFCLPASGARQLSSQTFSSVLPQSTTAPTDFRQVVIPITNLKLFGPASEAIMGTGFCLDPGCRFIVTNYHVAAAAHPQSIAGQKVLHSYLATGPSDDDATPNRNARSFEIRNYSLPRDLALFELRHPLPRHLGISYSLDLPEPGQVVEIYAFPKEGLLPVRSLLKFQGTFTGETTTGLLAFDYAPLGDKTILPGASGGIIVDAATHKIVGILNGIALDAPHIALAVPVQALFDFVSQVQPCLAAAVFPPHHNEISPVSPDLYPKPAIPPPPAALHERPPEPFEIQILRRNAQRLADSMRNFVAVQTFAWGSGDKPPSSVATYELQVLNGRQKFRKFPEGKQRLDNVPFPPLNTAMVPGGEWSELPAMIGTELNLRIWQAPDFLFEDQPLKVFQYRADPEDAICRFNSVADFLLFSVNRIATVGCYGEVWTDQHFNILRMSERYELPGKWKDYQAVLTYGWLRRPDESLQLVPLSISSQAIYNKKTYWCRGRFFNYRVFDSRVTMVAN